MIDGIFSDAERDKGIITIQETLKRIEEKVDKLACNLEKQEGEVDKLKDIVSQHKVWIFILSSGIVGIITGLLSGIVR